MPERAFLTAEWRHVALLNYEVAPELLAPRVPVGTAVDLWRGRALVSVVGFLFLRTKVLGWPIPCHRDFEEVNLRFYVRRAHAEGARRGVVFIKEYVPRHAVAWAARRWYEEPYEAAPMRHRTGPEDVSYAWGAGAQECRLSLRAAGEPARPAEDSQERFIAEHYWGYTRRGDGSTSEYRVEHPPWRVRRAAAARLEGNLEAAYGAAFAGTLARPPCSAFLAEGSPVTVFRGGRLGP